jgi:flavorubredoxin
VIHNHQGEGTAPVVVALNTMVIRGREPIVVDTGMTEHTDDFLADVFSLVDPADVRWVFITHDDVDHTGGLTALMDACPNATLVINWFMTERMGASLAVPPTRWRWVGDGESFSAGDRVLQAVRPPVYDSPTTRGLFDPTTGVYWAADSFAAPMITPVPTADSLDRQFWADGMAMFHQYVSPWLSLTDDVRFQQTVSRVESLGVTTIAGCHGPTIGASHVAEAFAIMRNSRAAVVPPEPDQSVLDEMLRAMAIAA